MCAVNTLQNLCAKMCVENKSILKHPVNISDIPLHIYEDLWNLTAIKKLEEQKNYLNCRIEDLEDKWSDADEKAEFYKDIWGQLSEGLKAINAPPSLGYHMLYKKSQDLTEMATVLEEWCNRKWGQLDDILEELKTYPVYPNVVFEIDDFLDLDDAVDKEYDVKVDTIFDQVWMNNIQIQWVTSEEEIL